MPRTRSGRTSTTSRRRIAGGQSSVPSTRPAPRHPSAPVAPYTRDTRWATPATPRNDVFVVDLGDRHASASRSDDDPLLLTA